MGVEQCVQETSESVFSTWAEVCTVWCLIFAQALASVCPNYLAIYQETPVFLEPPKLSGKDSSVECVVVFVTGDAP